MAVDRVNGGNLSGIPNGNACCKTWGLEIRGFKPALGTFLGRPRRVRLQCRRNGPESARHPRRRRETLGTAPRRGGARAREAKASARLFLKKARKSTVIVKNFRDGFFPFVGADIKRCFEQLKDVSPDLVFTHYRADRHQDQQPGLLVHRLHHGV